MAALSRSAWTRRCCPWPGPARRSSTSRAARSSPACSTATRTCKRWASSSSQIRLDECRSAEEMMELVRERARVTPPGEWIVGTGWNEGNFHDGRLPTRQDIDPATSQHPVLLMRFFNTDLVNTVALRLAGITRAHARPRRWPHRARCGRRAKRVAARQGQAARAAACAAAPQQQLVEAVRLGCGEFNRYGITVVRRPRPVSLRLHAYQAARDAGAAQRPHEPHAQLARLP